MPTIPSNSKHKHPDCTCVWCTMQTFHRQLFLLPLPVGKMLPLHCQQINPLKLPANFLRSLPANILIHSFSCVSLWYLCKVPKRSQLGHSAVMLQCLSCETPAICLYWEHGSVRTLDFQGHHLSILSWLSLANPCPPCPIRPWPRGLLLSLSNLSLVWWQKHPSLLLNWSLKYLPLSVLDYASTSGPHKMGYNPQSLSLRVPEPDYLEPKPLLKSSTTYFSISDIFLPGHPEAIFTHPKQPD